MIALVSFLLVCLGLYYLLRPFVMNVSSAVDTSSVREGDALSDLERDFSEGLIDEEQYASLRREYVEQLASRESTHGASH